MFVRPGAAKLFYAKYALGARLARAEKDVIVAQTFDVALPAKREYGREG